MADGSESFQASTSTSDAGNEDVEGDRRMAELMERLRARGHRTWDHTSKVIRNSMMDRRHQSEFLEKSRIQRHIETLQRAFKVTNVGAMVERLEGLARSANLKLLQAPVRHSGGTDIVIGSDLFSVQIALDNAAVVRDVRISHSGDPTTVNCLEFAESLSMSEFDKVQAHLEGLAAIYQINGDKKQRAKVFHTIQSLEQDLSSVSQLQKRINGVTNYIHKSPLGILQPRSGGLPMRLTYFVGPYDLLDEKTGTSYPMTVEDIIKHQLGYSVTIGIENSTPHKLQSVPLMTVNQTPDGRTLPHYSAVSAVNSTLLPAVFVLKLPRPVPLSLSIVRKIQIATNVEFADLTQTRPLLSLILQQMTRGKQDTFDKEKGLFVTLTDQRQCFFLNGVNGTAELAGLMVSRIPFTHPTHVPGILILLRQQVLFNSFIGSCMRQAPQQSGSRPQDLENCLIFEVTPISLQHVSVTFEHPLRESIATAEFDLSDRTSVRCKICSSEEEKICTDEQACKVVQRCLSLPVTMRSILQKATGDLDQVIQLQAALTLSQPTRSRQGQERRAAFVNMQPPADNQYSSAQNMYSAVSVQETMESLDAEFIDPNTAPLDIQEAIKADKISKNPILANLLDQDSHSPETPAPSMLSVLLADTPQANSTTKAKKTRKRRSTNDARSPGMGKSPKRKMSEDELSRELPSGIDLDNFDVTLGGPQPGSGGGNVQQVMNEGFGEQESHVSRLASTLDNIIIKAESKNYSGSHPQSEMLGLTNDLDKDVRRLKDDGGGGEGLGIVGTDAAIKTEIKMESAASKSAACSLVDLLNDSPGSSDSGNTRSATPINCRTGTPPVSATTGTPSVNAQMCTPPVNALSCTPSSNPLHGTPSVNSRTSIKLLSSSPKNSLVLPSSSSAGLTSQTTSAKATTSRKLSVSKNESVEYSNDHAMKEASGSMLAKMMADWPEKTAVESLENNRRGIAHGVGGSNAPPGGSTGTAVLNKNVDRKMVEDRSTGSSMKPSGDPRDDRFVMKDRVKREKSREAKEEEGVAGSSSRPLEREKLGITMKLNTKDFTAKTIVKASPSRDSPHPNQEVDAIRSSNKDTSSFSSTSSRPSKEKIRASPARVFDHNDDGLMNPNLTRTMLVSSDSSKPGSPSLRIKKIRPDDISSEKKRRSSKHGDISETGKRKKDDNKKERGAKRRRSIESGSEFGESKSVSTVKLSMEKVPRTFKITTAGSKMKIQTSPKSLPVSPGRPSSKSSLSSQGRSSGLLKPHLERGQSRTNRSLSGKPMSRSKSESQAIMSKMADSKLTQKPTIKLKPLVMPGTTVTVTTNKMCATAPVSRNSPTDPMAAAAAAALSKGKLTTKSRKGSLSAVIDKLTKQQNTSGSGGAGGMGIPRRESPTPPVKKDPIAEKNKLEAIRKEIIRAGTKPSTPTKEMGKSSQRKLEHSHEKAERYNNLLNRSQGNLLQKSGSSKLLANNAAKSSMSGLSKGSAGSGGGQSGDGSGRASSVTLKDSSSLSSSVPSLSSTSSSSSLSNSKTLSSISSSENVSKSKSVSSSLTSSVLTASGPVLSVSHVPDSHSHKADSGDTLKRDSLFYKDLHRDPYNKDNMHRDSHKESHKESLKDISHRDGYSKETHGREGRDLHSAAAASLISTSAASSSSSSNTTPRDTAKDSNPTTPSGDKSRKLKVEEHTDRTSSRHFLDAVTKPEPPSSLISAGSHKDIERNERKSSSRTNSENSRNDSHDRGYLNSNSNGNVSCEQAAKPNGPASRPTEGRVDPRLCKDDSNGGASNSRDNPRPAPAEVVNGGPAVSAAGGGGGGNSAVPCRDQAKASSNSSAPSGSIANHTAGSASDYSASSSCSHLAASSSCGASSTSSKSDSRHSVVASADITNSEDKENKEAEKVFKAPTPKSMKNSDGCEGHTDRHENKVRREKPVLSPRSDVSSPEDGLVIDCPGTPGSKPVRSPVSKNSEKPSPNAKSPAPVNSTDSVSCRSPVAMVTKSPRSPSPRKALSKTSPAASPAVKSPMMPRNSPVPVQHHSPCEIDDDLMDTALIL